MKLISFVVNSHTFVSFGEKNSNILRLVWSRKLITWRFRFREGGLMGPQVSVWRCVP